MFDLIGCVWCYKRGEHAMRPSVGSTCRKVCQLHASERNLRNHVCLPKKKIKPPTVVKEEEAPVIIPPGPIEDTLVWEKELDELFRTLREPKDDADPTCPLHAQVLKKKVSKKGWEYVRCSEKNCLIWLPWDGHLGYVLSEIQNKMHPSLRQGFFYCFCREPCKVSLTKRKESPNCGRCFLTCAQKNAQRERCHFFQWIDEVWGPVNAEFQFQLKGE